MGNIMSQSADAGMLDDVLPSIFGFLDWHDILTARVCKKWKEAATRTLVAPSSEWKCIEGFPPKETTLPQFSVTSAAKYNALCRMRDILPGLQQIYLGNFFRDSKDVGVMIFGVPKWALLQYSMTEIRYLEGEDPDDAALEEAEEVPSYDVSIIAGFPRLRHLHIDGAPLNGKYPCLFGFKELRELRIVNCKNLKLDLGMLSRLSKLEILECNDVDLSGIISSLKALKSTLRELTIGKCAGISGDVMDLADFPQLEVLDVEDTANIAADVRQIQTTHFPKLQKLYLPRVLDRISDFSAVIGAFHTLANRATYPCMGRVQLSDESPDRYDCAEWMPSPPFGLEMVKAGPRLGCRWSNLDSYALESCETNWLDPAPAVDSDGYAEYESEAEAIGESVDFYTGLSSPPSQAAYLQLCQDLKEKNRRQNLAMRDRLLSSGLFSNTPPN